MKKRIGVFICLLLVAVTLFLPAAKVNVHTSIEPELAAKFPATLSVGDILLKGSGALPTDEVAQLSLACLGEMSLRVGLLLLAAALVLGLIAKRGMLQASMAVGAAAACALFGFALQFNNACSSLLFGYLLESQFWVYVPGAAALLFAAWQFLMLHQAVKAETGDRTWECDEQKSAVCLHLGTERWRVLSAVLALLAALCVLLPYITVSVPATITESVSAGTIGRSVSIYQYALDSEATLNAAVVAAGESTDVLTGDLGVLNAYSNQSASNNNIKYIFQNPTANTSVDAYVLIGAGLLLVGALLALWKKADRWFSICCMAVGTVAVAAAMLS